jgi:hypothetical protein
MFATTRIMTGVGAYWRGPSIVVQVGYSVAERSRGRVVLRAVCTVHVETRSTGFFVKPQNQDRRFVSGLALKPLNGFLRFGLKTGGDGFFGLVLKPVVTVSWLSLKTKVVDDFPVWASKPVATVR